MSDFLICDGYDSLYILNVFQVLFLLVWPAEILLQKTIHVVSNQLCCSLRTSRSCFFIFWLIWSLFQRSNVYDWQDLRPRFFAVNLILYFCNCLSCVPNCRDLWCSKYIFLPQFRLMMFQSFILLHEKFLRFDRLRAVVFQLNLKFLHVKITNH